MGMIEGRIILLKSNNIITRKKQNEEERERNKRQKIKRITTIKNQEGKCMSYNLPFSFH
jgi:hypothetical protein